VWRPEHRFRHGGSPDGGNDSAIGATMKITEFLLARIAEDEALARTEIDDESAGWVAPRLRQGSDAALREVVVVETARRLAECEARRRIVAEVMAGSSPLLQGFGLGLEHALKHLAVPYADHPDYDESWRP
jgi:hypothetical protein